MPKILILEDDPDLRLALNIRLRANGFETAIAADAVLAVTIAKRERPDLLLLDLGLPGGDGFAVMERFRSHIDLQAVPIIVLTARDPALNRERALNAGATEFFQKPVDSDDLLAAIRRALGPTARVAR